VSILGLENFSGILSKGIKILSKISQVMSLLMARVQKVRVALSAN
jgi:hypothetical protein